MRRGGRSAAGAAGLALAAFGLLVPATAAARASAGAPAPSSSPHVVAGTPDTTPTTTPPSLPTTSTTSTTTPDVTTSTTDPGTTGTTGTTTTTTAGGAGSTSTTTGGTTAGGSTSGPSGTGPGGGSGGGGAGTASSTPPSSVPARPSDPRLQAFAASIPRTGPGTTWPLLRALAPLTHYGLTQLQTALVGFGNFPVAGPAYYTDDFLEYRSTPTPHLHQGIDIVAAPGTPLRSPTDGILTYSNSDPDGYGLTSIVTQPDHTTFVMAHMSATVLGLASGARVKTGQVVGFVGETGDATGPHCHFEVHPHGGAGVDGKPLLDHWLAQAEAAAPGLIAAYQAATSAAAEPPVVTVPDSVPIAPLVRRGHEPVPAAGALHRSGAPPVPVRVGGVMVALAVAGVGGWSLVRRRRSAVSTA
jgi:murein DD-endopeptidase MepM/ murein hydrolase activator NlpD